MLNRLELYDGFVQDFGKVEAIKNENPEFNQTYDFIADNLGLVHSETGIIK